MLDEAGNHGVLTPFWDLVFGTYVAASACKPERLRLSEPECHPASSDLWACVWLPFRR
jgi:sterol desaturase/sphingolipid hydroxylase (fatty acid hydroxylase superfamily)